MGDAARDFRAERPWRIEAEIARLRSEIDRIGERRRWVTAAAVSRPV
jgi:hypothetical protein